VLRWIQCSLSLCRDAGPAPSNENGRAGPCELRGWRAHLGRARLRAKRGIGVGQATSPAQDGPDVASL
jgi:hypothetical protein